MRAGWKPVAVAAALLDGGATLLQLRAKRDSSETFLAFCEQVIARAAAYHATVIVNDRVDLALLSGAAGAHVGQDDLGVEQARALLGPRAIVGFSTHSVEQFAAGAQTSATYLAIGPVFGTSTKATGYSAVGLDLIRAARRIARVPIVAIGGVTLENAQEALDAGASMVAVISDLLVGGDPTVRARAYVDRLRVL